MAVGFCGTQNTIWGVPRQIRTICNQDFRIRPRLRENVHAYRETPLRLAKSRLTAVARLHSACGRLSQPYGLPAPLSGELRRKTSPERGGGPRVAWRWGFAGHRIPTRESTANPYNPRRTFYVFALEFAKSQLPTAKPLSQPVRAASSPFRGALRALKKY